MPALPLFDMNHKKVGTVELNDSVFSAEPKAHLIHDMVRVQIARRYEWKTANSKTRTEVQATRKKMYKQKGTGQARHGDAKAPIFVGGGKAHGPKPRLVIKKINKKVAKAALRGALSLKQKQDKLFVVKDLSFDKPSTKQAQGCLKSFGVSSTLVVNAGETPAEVAFNGSCKNIRGVKFLKPEGVNVFDLLKFDSLVISQKAVQILSERLAHV